VHDAVAEMRATAKRIRAEADALEKAARLLEDTLPAHLRRGR